MIPENFDGKFIMNIDGEPLDVHFYRREDEKFSIGEFIDSIKPEDIAWDKPTRQLFYKDAKGKTYVLKFKQLK